MPDRIPDAFFPYRVGKIPYLVINNNHEVQSINSVHRIYFKNLSKNEIRWIHVSMLSIYCQLSIDAISKTYGRGMLKIEPGMLGSILVLKLNNSSIDDVYDNILIKLKNEEKKEATEIATSFLNLHLNISDELKILARKAWNEINVSN